MIDKKVYKVRDHCHYTGQYRSAVHSIYNSKYKVPKKILIVYHNGSSYDYHFLGKGWAEEFFKKYLFRRKH